MKIILTILGLLLSIASSQAQSVQQSGTVTPGHAAQWVTNGVVKDAGTAASGSLTSLGVTQNGTGICQNSAAVTAAGYQQICLGTTTAGGGVLSVQNFGTATAQGLSISINGTVVTIPTGGSAIPTIDVPVISNSYVCTSGTTGLLVDCFITAPITKGGTGATTAADARTNLGLGSISVQDASAVAITGGTITGMPNPSIAADVANKAYVDGVATGLTILSPVRLASAAVMPNSPTYSNGTLGVGATLTAGSNVALTVDGTAAVLADRILVKNQAAPAQNGIYTVTVVGSGAAAWVLTRATDFDQAAEMKAGSYTFVTAGATNINAAYVLQTAVTTVGTDPLTFIQFSQSSVGVSSLGGQTGAIGIGTGLTISGGNLLTTLWTNTRLAKTANYSVASADCGDTLALGGAGYFTLTFNAASGYTTNCVVYVVNEDTGRAKSIAVDGYTAFKLWPLQTAVIYNQNNVWQISKPNRWKHPGGTLNTFSDFTLGSDTNDCLAAGAGNACKTAQQALYLACDQFDFTGTAGGQTQLVVNLAASTTDTTGIHYSCVQVGAQGGAAIRILGTTGSVIGPTSATALGVFVNAIVQVEAVRLQSTNADAVAVDLGGQVYINDNVQFATTGGNHMNASGAGSEIMINGDYQIFGGATTAHMLASAGGIIRSLGAHTATWGAGATFAFFAITSNNGTISTPSMTYNLNSFTSTGQRFNASNFSIVYSGGQGINFFPGNSAGSADAATGGFYNFLLKRDLDPAANDNSPMWLATAA